MKKETEAAGVFLKNVLKKSDKLNSEQVDNFVERFVDLLQEKYKGHWYPENPLKGQAFRCIRVNGHHSKDAELLLACQKSGVQYCYLGLPLELTLWVDPGEVSCRYSEDTPPFTFARVIGDDDDDDDSDENENVLIKVRSAQDKVTSDYHSETSSDDDCTCLSPPPGSDRAFTTALPERDGDSVRVSPQSIFGATLSTENSSVSDTSLANRHGGGSTTPPYRSPSLQVVYRGPQPSSRLSWRTPVRSCVEPQPYFMLNPCVKPFPTANSHGWSRAVYRNAVWNSPSGQTHHGNSTAVWPFARNERKFEGKMNLNRTMK